MYKICGYGFIIGSMLLTSASSGLYANEDLEKSNEMLFIPVPMDWSGYVWRKLKVYLKEYKFYNNIRDKTRRLQDFKRELLTFNRKSHRDLAERDMFFDAIGLIEQDDFDRLEELIQENEGDRKECEMLFIRR